jgi:hypothetical protein
MWRWSGQLCGRSQLGDGLSLLRFVIVFLSNFTQMPGQYLKLATTISFHILSKLLFTIYPTMMYYGPRVRSELLTAMQERTTSRMFMRSPCCLCVCVSPLLTFECLSQTLWNLVCTSWHLTSSQRHTRRIHATIEELLDTCLWVCLCIPL